MNIVVDVVLDPQSRAEAPPPGTPLRVQLRDTTATDGPAKVLAEVRAEVAGAGASVLASVVLAVDGEVVDPRADLTLWVHGGAAGVDRVRAGDWLTTQAIPLPAARLRDGGQPLRFEAPVRRIGGGRPPPVSTAT